MNDDQILDLYWSRNEAAIAETEKAYGNKLSGLAYRILQNSEDSQECVNDTYLKAWQAIPPQRPVYFFAWLAKICRHFALGRLDWNNAAKRKAEVVQLTSEMELCIPDSSRDRALDGQEIGQLLNEFLAVTPKESRMIFLRRYWYADSVAEIAARFGIGESKVKTSLHRTRNRLKVFLEKEGITV